MISGYVGLIGHGKTMLAVRESVALARRRRAILASNIGVTAPGVEVVRLSVGEDGLEGVPELLERARSEGRGVVILADELGIITPARFWQSGMSIELMWAVSQSRKLGADLIFTAQSEEQIDAFLRRLTWRVSKVRAVPAPTVERREREQRPWFFIATDWLPGTVDKPDKRLGRSMIRYRRKWESWYSTDELVRPPSFLRGRRPRSSARAGAADWAQPGPLVAPLEGNLGAGRAGAGPRDEHGASGRDGRPDERTARAGHVASEAGFRVLSPPEVVPRVPVGRVKVE